MSGGEARRGTSAARLCETLRREILTLELRPGEPIDEMTVSKRFGVSRSPVREALNRLVAERLAVATPNRGTVVAPVDIAHFASFIEALDLQQRYATRLAARHRSDDDLARLSDLAAAFEVAAGRFSHIDILQTNYEFHYAVGEVGRNPYIARQYGDMLSEARRLLHIHLEYLANTGRESVMKDQHGDILRAIAARDVDAADAAAHAHTRQFHDRFLEALRYRPDLDFALEFRRTACGGAAP